ncbi:hypothetical protein F383_17554 [Gossypium arboreum]|uniref:Uncharacterized protein n=1 Tax=Gossypium arboreum TaxID=29729 RepID=A0A0B0NFR0_GOSAR|nr:hypothetical protein F383_17554 [Gossypium arboreum]
MIRINSGTSDKFDK